MPTIRVNATTVLRWFVPTGASFLFVPQKSTISLGCNCPRSPNLYDNANILDHLGQRRRDTVMALCCKDVIIPLKCYMYSNLCNDSKLFLEFVVFLSLIYKCRYHAILKRAPLLFVFQYHNKRTDLSGLYLASYLITYWHLYSHFPVPTFLLLARALQALSDPYCQSTWRRLRVSVCPETNRFNRFRGSYPIGSL